MWDEIFTIDMLTDSSMVTVNCPTEELEREFATLLDERGIRYPNGDSPLRENHWGRYGVDFCYYIKDKEVRYGPKRSTNESPWSRYEKYTFQGGTAGRYRDRRQRLLFHHREVIQWS